MTDTRFDVYFSGQLVAGVSAEQAADQLAQLFKTQPERLAHLFTGNPVAVKRDVGRAEAIKYRQALSQAGMTSVFREHGAAAPAPAPAPAPSLNRNGDPNPDRAPNPNGARNPDPGPGPASNLDQAANGTAPSGAPQFSLAPVGSDVLTPDERPHVEPVTPDLSGLSLAPPGTELLRPEERSETVTANIDISALKLV